MWNQHFNGFYLKSTFVKAACCKRSIFCWILREITVFAVMCWRHNKRKLFAYVISQKRRAKQPIKFRMMCFYSIGNDMQNFRHFCKKKKNTSDCHLAWFCTQPFNWFKHLNWHCCTELGFSCTVLSVNYGQTLALAFNLQFQNRLLYIAWPLAGIESVKKVWCKY